MTDKFDSYIKKVEKIQKELEGRITNKQEMDVYIQFRLEGMAEVGAIEMLNSFGYKELLAIAKFRRLYSHYFPNELAEQNKRYRKLLTKMNKAKHECTGFKFNEICADVLDEFETLEDDE